MYVTPIAITLCFGLAFATLLVLIVIPALLLLLERGKARAGRRMAGVLAMARAALPTPNSTVTTEPDNRSA